MGHVYLGRTRRGLAWAATGYAAIGLVLLFREVGSASMAAFVLGGAAIWVGSIVDAAVIAPGPRPFRGVHIALLAVGLFFASRGYALLARARVLEAFKIPAGSMLPSIRVGDHVFVDKVVYRHRAPRRGEIAVFPYPEHPEQDFVKRVIALPGDKLEMRKGHPIINGWDVPSCQVGTWKYNEALDDSAHDGELFIEFLEESAYFVFFDRLAPSSDYEGPFQAAKGEIWLLGDNRNNSHDSRMWFGGRGGGVKRETLVGRPHLLWLAISPERVDWSRIGQDVSGDPVAPSPDLRAAVASCLGQRPSVPGATPPPPAPR